MGLPATGKTTISKKIAEVFNLPLLARDEIKTKIMDSVGWGDREWSKKIGKTSYDLIYYFIDKLVCSEISFIVESDFAPEFANEKFDRIRSQDYEIIQVICWAKEEIIKDRWRKRSTEDKTHPSSVEGEAGFNDLLKMISAGPRQPLDIQGEVIYIDTSDSQETNYLKAINRLRILI